MVFGHPLCKKGDKSQETASEPRSFQPSIAPPTSSCLPAGDQWREGLSVGFFYLAESKIHQERHKSLQPFNLTIVFVAIIVVWSHSIAHVGLRLLAILMPRLLSAGIPSVCFCAHVTEDNTNSQNSEKAEGRTLGSRELCPWPLLSIPGHSHLIWVSENPSCLHSLSFSERLI